MHLMFEMKEISMRYAAILLISGMLVLAAGCEPDPQAVKLDRQLVTTYGDESVSNAVLVQHTVYPYHFEIGGADLNTLGEKDLTVLAGHFVKYPGPLNVRRGPEVKALYRARVDTVKQFLLDAGVDGRRVNISDDLAGGDGLTSNEVVIIVNEAYGATEAFERQSIGSGN